jgi:hypothetical protein
MAHQQAEPGNCHYTFVNAALLQTFAKQTGGNFKSLAESQIGYQGNSRMAALKNSGNGTGFGCQNATRLLVLRLFYLLLVFEGCYS